MQPLIPSFRESKFIFGKRYKATMLYHYLIMTKAFFEHLGTDAETAFRHFFALAQPILDQ